MTFRSAVVLASLLMVGCTRSRSEPAVAAEHGAGLLNLSPTAAFDLASDAGTRVVMTGGQYHAFVAESDAGWLLLWSDRRLEALRGADIYAARVLPDGGLLDPVGFPVSTAPGDQLLPSASWDGRSWVVVWSDERAPLRWEIYGTQVLADGTVVNPRGAFIERAIDNGRPEPQARPMVASRGQSTLLAWRGNDTFSPVGYNWIGLDGVTVVSPRQVDPIFFSQFQVGLAVENSEFVVTWGESLNGTVHRVAVTPGDAGVISRVSAQGPGDLHQSSGAAVPAGTQVIMWTAGNLVDTATAQRFDAAGAAVGGPIFVSPDVRGTSQVAVAQDGTRFMLGYMRNPEGIETRTLDVAGNLSSVLVNDPIGSYPHIAASPAGRLLAYSRPANPRLASLALGDPLATGPAPAALRARPNSAQPAAAELNGQFLVVWSEGSPGGTRRDIWGWRLNLSAADPYVDPDPVLIGQTAGEDVDPAVIASNGGWWVVWRSIADDARLFRVRVTPPLTVSAPELVAHGSPFIGPPAIASSGSEVMVAADDLTSSFWWGCWTWPFLSDGGIGLENRTIFSDQFHANTFNCRAVPVPGGFAVVTLAAQGNPNNTLLARYATMIDGGVSESSTLSTLRTGRYTMAAAPMPGGLVLVHEADAGNGDPILFADRVFLLADGGLYLDGGFLAARSVDGGALRHPSLTVVNGGELLLGWTDNADVATPRARATVLSTRGISVDPAGVDLAPVATAAPTFAPGPSGQVLAMWNSIDAPPGNGIVGRGAVLTVHSPLGMGCGNPSQCTSGFCVDGVCCNTACGNGAVDCQTCNGAAGGVCTLSSAAVVCRPLRFECDLPESCSGGPTCPSDGLRTFGACLDAGPGTCSTGGYCLSDEDGGVLSGPSDGGEDAGVDAGVDGGAGGGAGGGSGGGSAGGSAGGSGGGAGGGSAGGSAGGTAGGSGTGGGSAGGAAGGGGEQTDGGAVEHSHYSWNQPSCHCGATDGTLGLGALLLFAFRRRRSLVGLAVVFVAATASAAPARLKIALPGVSATDGISKGELRTLEADIQRVVAFDGRYDLISQDDIAALIGIERQRQLLGCSEDTSCIAEIANALAAERIITGSVSRAGGSYVLSFTLLDAATGKGIRRVGDRLKGANIDDVLDAVEAMIRELLNAELPAPAQPAAAAPKLSFYAGVLGVVDAVGLAAGQPAVAPGVVFGISRGMFGGLASVIITPTPGVRLEGVFSPLYDGRVQPALRLGATIFGSSVGLRAALALGLAFGKLVVGLEAGAEYFVSGPADFKRLAVVIGLGVGWRF